MEPSDAETSRRSTGPPEEDLSWSDLLAAFRAGPRDAWSGLLIERIGPWLTSARRTLIAAPPYLDQEDVRQQLVLEVLGIAARWQPCCDDNWIPRRLAESAARRVHMKLSRERSRAVVELDEELEAAEGAEPELPFDTQIGKASAADLLLIYRVKVLGEPVAELAREAGITPRQMRQRVWAARERARASSAGVNLS